MSHSLNRMPFVPIVPRQLSSLLPTAPASRSSPRHLLKNFGRTGYRHEASHTNAAARRRRAGCCSSCFLYGLPQRLFCLFVGVEHHQSDYRFPPNISPPFCPLDSLILGHQEKAPRYPNPPPSLPRHPRQLGWKWRELTGPDEQRMERRGRRSESSSVGHSNGGEHFRGGQGEARCMLLRHLALKLETIMPVLPSLHSASRLVQSSFYLGRATCV